MEPVSSSGTQRRCGPDLSTFMGEQPLGTEPAQGASGGQETIVRNLHRRKWAAITAFLVGGVCLAFGLALTGDSLRGAGRHLAHILTESIGIAAGVLLIAAAIAVLIVLILVAWCFWAAIRNVGDQGTANRWLDLATRMVYIVAGGWLKGLTMAPAQLSGEVKAFVSAGSQERTASFWELLTPTERAELAASAVEMPFQTGSILCREGQRADHVFVIRSGRIAVCVESPGRQQVVAIRRAGDIVGERAAFQAGERSATITALQTVTAYVVPTESFSAFLHRHPHVLRIIEDQIYGRLTEDRPLRVVGESQCTARAKRQAGSWNGQNCTIVLIDIANFGASTRCDSDRRRIRTVLYRIAQGLFENSDWQHDHHCEDRGDGILMIVPPHVPTSSIVNRILDNLVTLLRWHNSASEAATRIQMRVALNVGPVVSDAHGVDGLAIIHAARLLDAPALKRDLAASGADLGFITSSFVYDTIIRPNPGHVGSDMYHQLKCRVKRQTLNAWTYITQTSSEIQLSTPTAFTTPGQLDSPGRSSPGPMEAGVRGGRAVAQPGPDRPARVFRR